jgi:hypothetical protein
LTINNIEWKNKKTEDEKMQRNFLQEKKNTIRLFSFLRKRPKESNTLENSEKLEKGNN